MAINASFGGTPELVHDGGDTLAWTGSSVIGTSINFSSTDEANSGTQSVHVNSPSVGDVWQFDRGSNIDLSGYSAITMWINVDRRWGVGDEVSLFGWDTSTNSPVGSAISLGDYINIGDNDIWQEATILLSEMNLEGSIIDSLRMEMVANDGTTPEFYIDDFNLQESGGEVFRIEPPRNTKVELNEISLNFDATVSTTLADASMPNLSYDEYLTAGKLTNGLLFFR